MGNQIILAPEAEQDLNEIVAYIAKDNPAAAEKFGIHLIERIELLKSFPRLGRVVRGRRGERVLVEGGPGPVSRGAEGWSGSLFEAIVH